METDMNVLPLSACWLLRLPEPFPRQTAFIIVTDVLNVILPGSLPVGLYFCPE